MGTHLTETDVLQLVEIYKDYDCLWNATHELYKDKDARQNAYKEILKKLNVRNLTVKDIPKKIKNLRSSYYQEIKRIRNSVRLGASKDSVYKPKVLWFSIADGFLNAFRNERGLSLKRQVNMKNIAKKDSSISEESSRIKKNAEAITPSNKNNEDEFDSFGKYIATTLRTMPQEFSIEAKTKLQRTISDIQLRIVRHNTMTGSNQSSYCSASTSSDHELHQFESSSPSSNSFITNVKIEYEYESN